MDFRGLGRPLVIGPDISAHFVGLTPRGEPVKGPCATTTLPIEAPLGVSSFLGGLCLFGLGVRSQAVRNNLHYDRFSIASTDAYGDFDGYANQRLRRASR